jgi:hypothetical protein
LPLAQWEKPFFPLVNMTTKKMSKEELNRYIIHADHENEWYGYYRSVQSNETDIVVQTHLVPWMAELMALRCRMLEAISLDKDVVIESCQWVLKTPEDHEYFRTGVSDPLHQPCLSLGFKIYVAIGERAKLLKELKEKK